MRITAHLMSQLADVGAWRRDSARFDLIDYSMCVGTPDLIAALIDLADPETVLHEGEHYWSHSFDVDTYRAWWSKLGDKREIQKVMNHIHLSSLIQDQLVSDELAVYLGHAIAAVWSKTLRDKDLIAEAYGSGLNDVHMTFFRKCGDPTQEDPGK